MIRNGKVVKTVVKSLRIDEVSGVDSPAMKPAIMALMKRQTSAAEPITKVQISMALTTMTGGHSHLITLGGGEVMRRAGQTDYVDGHAHPWLLDEGGNLVVGHALGHSHGIEVISKADMPPAFEGKKKKAKKEEDDAHKEMCAKSDSGGEPPQDDGDGSATDVEVDDNDAESSTADETGTQAEDKEMTQPSNATAADTAAVQKQADELAKLTKRAERAEAVAALSDNHRSYFKALKGEDAEAFLKASEMDREDTIRKANEANQVVYTAKDGTTFRKNDDPRLVKMARELDESRARQAESEQRAVQADLVKRAGELSHIPGDEAARVALLKGIDAIPDATQREAALKALKAQNAAMAKSFTRVGTSNTPSADMEGSEDPVDKLAAEIQKRDGGTFEQAYTKALNTKAGRTAYEAHLEKRHPARV